MTKLIWCGVVRVFYFSAAFVYALCAMAFERPIPSVIVAGYTGSVLALVLYDQIDKRRRYG